MRADTSGSEGSKTVASARPLMRDLLWSSQRTIGGKPLTCTDKCVVDADTAAFIMFINKKNASILSVIYLISSGNEKSRPPRMTLGSGYTSLDSCECPDYYDSHRSVG